MTAGDWAGVVLIALFIAYNTYVAMHLQGFRFKKKGRR